MIAPSRLEFDGTRSIAYHKTPASGEGASAPGIIFLGGYSSDMTGTKAVWLEDWARARGRAFLRFDYTGHGSSSGKFSDGCISDWADDAAEVLTRLTDGPQILVGSSMGGWITLLLARRMPERIAAFVGIAAAPDFTEDSIWPNLPEDQRATLMSEGQLDLPSDHPGEPFIITRRIIEDGRENLVLRSPLALPFPVRLLQGTADADVPTTVALRLLDHADCPDARLTLIKGAGHRLSEPSDLALLGTTLETLPV